MKNYKQTDFLSVLDEAYNNLFQPYEEQINEENINQERKEVLYVMKDMGIITYYGVPQWKNDKGQWTPLKTHDNIKQALIDYNSAFDTKHIAMIMKWLPYLIKTVDFKLDKPYNNIVLFNNGYIDLEEPITILHSVDWSKYDKIPLNVIPFDYNPNLTNTQEYKIMEQFINWCAKGDKTETKSIYTMLGIIMTNRRVEFFFNLFGTAGSGKSTLLDLCIALVGDKVSTSPIQNISKQFGLSPLINKDLLADGDVRNDPIDPQVLKKLTTIGQKWEIEVKGVEERIETLLPLNVILNSNNILKFKESEGINRRLVPIEFPYPVAYEGDNFKAVSPNDMFIVKPKDTLFQFTKAAVESIIPIIVEHLKEFHKYENSPRQYTVDNNPWPYKSTYFDNVLHTTKLTADNFLYWVETYDLLERYTNWKNNENDYYIQIEDLYALYSIDTKENGARPLNRNNFTNALKAYLNSRGVMYKSGVILQISGVRKRYFTISREQPKLITVENLNKKKVEELTDEDLDKLFAEKMKKMGEQ